MEKTLFITAALFPLLLSISHAVNRTITKKEFSSRSDVKTMFSQSANQEVFYRLPQLNKASQTLTNRFISPGVFGSFEYETATYRLTRRDSHSMPERESQ